MTLVLVRCPLGRWGGQDVKSPPSGFPLADKSTGHWRLTPRSRPSTPASTQIFTSSFPQMLAKFPLNFWSKIGSSLQVFPAVHVCLCTLPRSAVLTHGWDFTEFVDLYTIRMFASLDFIFLVPYCNHFYANVRFGHYFLDKNNNQNWSCLVFRKNIIRDKFVAKLTPCQPFHSKSCSAGGTQLGLE